MAYTWFIARRLYRANDSRRRASRSAIVIATAGVALGLAIMLLSVCVVLGFKSEVERKVTGMGGHIQILNYQSLIDTEAQPIAISDSLVFRLSQVSGVSDVRRYCQKAGMLKTDASFQGVVFRGIAPDYKLDFLRSCLVEGSLTDSFSETESTGRLAVSQMLARQLGLHVGDKVYAYFFDQTLRARRFTIEAVYATYLSEYDERMVFCDMHTIRRLLGYGPDQYGGAELSLARMDQLSEVSDQVSRLVNHRQDNYGQAYTSPTIRDTYPHIFAWLDLLDLNVVVILVLMLAVAGFTTVSGLLIIILERTQFIGIFKAMGAPDRTLRHVFLWYAMLLVGRGMIIGNVFALAFCYVQQRWGLVTLDAATYYVHQMPIQLSWTWIAVINLLTLLLSALALLLPTLVVSRISPSRAIRFE